MLSDLHINHKGGLAVVVAAERWANKRVQIVR